ncbi:hypothetical protein RIF29_41841 [Crotalaria pallida]|uniref:Uncharacterized protein n=1 Tax=Crotalaria pallida TaxID=3830 RepID=A0AAN9E8T4_CROPI
MHMVHVAVPEERNVNGRQPEKDHVGGSAPLGGRKKRSLYTYGVDENVLIEVDVVEEQQFSTGCATNKVDGSDWCQIMNKRMTIMQAALHAPIVVDRGFEFYDMKTYFAVQVASSFSISSCHILGSGLSFCKVIDYILSVLNMLGTNENNCQIKFCEFILYICWVADCADWRFVAAGHVTVRMEKWLGSVSVKMVETIL